MIQLRIDPYTSKERKVILKLMREANESIAIYLCKNGVLCSECEYRHVCRDIECVIEYLENSL